MGHVLPKQNIFYPTHSHSRYLINLDVYKREIISRNLIHKAKGATLVISLGWTY